MAVAFLTIVAGWLAISGAVTLAFILLAAGVARRDARLAADWNDIYGRRHAGNRPPLVEAGSLHPVEDYAYRRVRPPTPITHIRRVPR